MVEEQAKEQDQTQGAHSQEPESGPQAPAPSTDGAAAAATQEPKQEGGADAVAALEQELASAREQLKDAQERMLRAVADAQNSRRRAQQDVEKAHKFALKGFAGALLPVVDSLESGLKSIESPADSNDPVREGMELTLKLFCDTLKRFQIEPLNPVGEPLDPNLHQAMSMVANPDMEPNTVMDVVQKGYTLNGRVLRPAMVVVAKAP